MRRPRAGIGGVALIVLLVAAFALSLLISASYTRSWRAAFVVACAGIGVLIVAGTELPSIGRRLTPLALVAWWLVVDAALLAWVWTLRHRLAERPRLPRPLERGDVLLIAAILGVLVVGGVVALAAAPTTWDSMTYHMSRVMHWAQNRSVAHYPTNITRQLYMNPWSEFATLHLVLLAGGDRFAALPQWLASVGCALLAAMITGELGYARRARLMAALLTVTIPMAAVQASSTQNDFVAAFWVMGFAWVTLRLHAGRAILGPTADYVLAGACLGLAILTKATAYVFAFPFALWLLVIALRARRGRALVMLSACGLIALSLNLGAYARNLKLYGTPLGGIEAPYRNGTLAPLPILGNLVRNAAFHLATPAPAANAAITRALRTTWSAVTRTDIDDPRTTWPGYRFEVGGLRQEDSAASPLHFPLYLFTAAVLLFRRRSFSKPVLAYAGAAALAIVMFSVVVRWQPWHTRLQLPLFIMGAPLAAIVMQRTLRPALSAGLVALLLFYTLGILMLNTARPVSGPSSVFRVPRGDQYFKHRKDLIEPYTLFARQIRAAGCTAVGFYSHYNGFEYPLWQRLGPGIRVHHVFIDNVSEALSPATTDEEICAIVTLERTSPAWQRVHAAATRSTRFGDVTLDLFQPPIPLRTLQ